MLKILRIKNFLLQVPARVPVRGAHVQHHCHRGDSCEKVDNHDKADDGGEPVEGRADEFVVDIRALKLFRNGIGYHGHKPGIGIGIRVYLCHFYKCFTYNEC
jgi:hypothetical protein